MKVMIKNLVLAFAFLLIFVGEILSQRILMPTKSQSLVATPAFLIRSGNINNLEINNIVFPDTINVGEQVTISAYIENTSNEVFDGNINVNFNFDAAENVDMNDPESSEVDDNCTITNLLLNPGESQFFTKDVSLHANLVSPNSTNVVIVWPAFNVGFIGQTAETNASISLVSFFTNSLSNVTLEGGKVNGASTNLDNSLKIAGYTNNNDLLQFNSISTAYDYLISNDLNIEQAYIYSFDGKQRAFKNISGFSLFDLIERNQNTFFIVSMRVKNPEKTQQIVVKIQPVR